MSFSFGNSAGASGAPASFSFNPAPTGNSAPNSFAAGGSGTGGFNFGAAPSSSAATDSKPNLFGASGSAGGSSSASAAAAPFSFGAGLGTSSVGSTAPAATGTTPSFSFGGSTGSGANSNSSVANPAVSFGSADASKTSAPSSTSFSFGATSTPAAAPSAAGGFNFGSTSAPTETKPTASAAPSFSFGGAPVASDKALSAPSTSLSFGGAPAASEKASSTATSSFSFGNTGAAAQPSATSSTPAFSLSNLTAGKAETAQSSTKPEGKKYGLESAAPATSTLSFGFGAPASASAAQPGASAVASAAPVTSINSSLPAEYSTMDVKGILQQWYKELAEDAKEFEQQAQRIAVWDGQLRGNQKSLESIVDDVHRIMTAQNELKHSCESIEAYQTDLQADLLSISNTLDQELEALQLQEPTEADFEREKTFSMAEELNQNLNQMELQLKKIVEEFNKSRYGSGDSGKLSGEDTNPIGKIIAVLNAHHESLAWLDEKSNVLKDEVGILKNRLLKSQKLIQE